jgi:phosphate:Na+ symporter
MLTFKAIYAVIVGIYLGDCVTTAIVCSIGAKADARRVGIVNILFNLSKTLLVLVVVAVIHRLGLLASLWDRPVNSGIIANTNTVFNLCCAVTLLPMLGVYEKFSRRIVKDDHTPEEKYKDELEALNPVFFVTPALALRSCYQLLLTIFLASRSNIEKSFRLLKHFDEAVYDEIQAEEDEIDRMTDRVSRYTVELLPHLQLDYHVAILDQYYKVTAEFERLGDHAVNIAEHASSLIKNNTSFSPAALSELSVLEDAITSILDETDQTFRKRDVDAARRIEPLVQVTAELITLLKHNHLQRMSRGECNIFADATFTNLMVEFRRIADVCSNVGVATVVRVSPELADHEHLYYERLHEGDDEEFNAAYERAYNRYFSLLKRDSSGEPSPSTYLGEPEMPESSPA